MPQVKEKITFENNGQTFSAMYSAQDFLKLNGYSYGSTDYTKHVAIVKGEYNLPEKWKNMTVEQRNSVNGIITSLDYRDGSVEVILYR